MKTPEAETLLKHPLVMTSLLIGMVALFISTFNWIMFAPNEFDPILIEMELYKRKRAHEEQM